MEVLDLKHFNRLERKRWFCFIVEALQARDFLALIDLKDAYPHVPIHPSSRKVVHFTCAYSHF